MITSQTATVHGVFISVFGIGTLLLGQSGIGKSDLALSLIDRGHALIADDMVEFSTSDKNTVGWADKPNNLVGCSPQLLKNCLEIRGIGVIDVVKQFGSQAVLKKQSLSLVVQLQEVESLPHQIHFDHQVWSLLGINVPLFHLPLTKARPREVLLEVLVKNHLLMQQGHDANRDFLANHRKKLSICA